MGVIFISHSSKNNAQAVRVRDWLREQGWNETFLDLDPEHGLAPGQRWQDELKRAGERCSAVVVLVSPEWAASKWCLTEFLLASQLGKRIFPVIIAPTPFADLPIELTAHFQLADISEASKEADGFERLRFGLKRAGLDPNDFPWPPPGQPGRSPYRGLRTLEEEDAAIFFGRDAAITSGLDELRKMRDGSPKRMLVILGASGAGKSSFLRAGLLSRLRRDTENFIVLPTVRPERASLTGAQGLVRSLGVEEAASRDDIAEHMAAIRAPVLGNFRRLAEAGGETWAGRPPTIVLPIDQAEEFFSAENVETPAALALLEKVIAAEPDLVVVLTIRSDSFEQLQSDGRLAGIPRQPFDLPRLSPSAFKEVIEGPGRVAVPRITIEPALSERLLADLNSGDGLPLLAFTLERLVLDHAADGMLKLGEYQDSLGGLSGAISKAVEAAFVAAGSDPKLPKDRAELEALARHAFIPWLVRIDDVETPPKRRVARLSELPEKTRALASKFVDQRLLVTDDTPDGQTTVEVSHEAVLRNWSLLSAWIGGEREALGRAERVIRAAADWRAQKDGQGRLDPTLLVHRGERLLGAEALLERKDFVGLIGQSGVEYIRACRELQLSEERRRRADRRAKQLALWSFVFALAIVAPSFLALGLYGIDQARTALAAQSRVSAQSAREAMEGGDAIAASLLALESWGDEGTSWWSLLTRWTVPDRPEASAMLKFALEPEGKQKAGSAGHVGRVTSIIFSPDGKQVLTASSDQTVRLWDAATGMQLQVFEGHSDLITSAIFSPDGKHVLTASNDQTARLWDAATGVQLRTFEGHRAAVRSANFSPDGKWVLTASDDQTAQLWNVTTGAQLRVFEGRNGGVSSAIFSADGKQVLTANNDRTALLWDVATGAQLRAFEGHQAAVGSAIFSPDGQQVLTAGDDAARLWDVTTGAQLRVFETQYGGVNSAMFSADGKQVLTANNDQTALLWDVATGAQLRAFEDHPAAVRSAIFSPDDKQVLTTSDDQTARLWDVTTGTQLRVFGSAKYGVSSAVFSADGKQVLTGGYDQPARLWHAATGVQVLAFEGHSGAVMSAIFSADGKQVLTASWDQTARLGDAVTGKQLRVFKGHGGIVLSATFSADGKQVLTASGDQTARLWDAGTAAQLRTFEGHNSGVSSAIFSADGKQVLTASDDRTARLWDARTGAQLHAFQGHSGVIWSAIFSPDDKQVLTASIDGTARLWDAATGVQLRTFEGHRATVRSANFSPDGKWVLTASDDQTAKLWNVTTGAQLRVFEGHNDPVRSAVFSPDGKQVLTASEDGTARLWDAATGVQLETFEGHYGVILSAVFSADGKQVLTASSDQTARLWDAATGTQLRTFEGHGATVMSAMFSADGKQVLTSSMDNSWKIWFARGGALDVSDEWELATYARQKVTRCLSQEERQKFGLGPAPKWCKRFVEASISNDKPSP